MASADLELASNIHFKKDHEDDEDGQSGDHVSDGGEETACKLKISSVPEKNLLKFILSIYSYLLTTKHSPRSLLASPCDSHFNKGVVTHISRMWL